MPAYEVIKSIKINKPTAEVINLVADFKTWPTWSPWLIMEPDCPITYSGDQGKEGSGYYWKGNLVGEGKMQLLERSAVNLDMALEFIKPFKSKAVVGFQLNDLGDSCEISWIMKGNLPWFLFFMKNMMKLMIGMDYERGLKMLKSLLETGEVQSNLELKGKQTQTLQYYIGLQSEASIKELPELIPADFGRLNTYFTEKNIEPDGAPFSMYHKMDMKTGISQLVNCFPVKVPIIVEPPFICDKLPQGNTYVVKHTGKYEFMGNAWSYAMFAARNFKVKLRKQPVGYENYISDPTAVDSKELVTEVVLFTR